MEVFDWLPSLRALSELFSARVQFLLLFLPAVADLGPLVDLSVAVRYFFSFNFGSRQVRVCELLDTFVFGLMLTWACFFCLGEYLAFAVVLVFGLDCGEGGCGQTGTGGRLLNELLVVVAVAAVTATGDFLPNGTQSVHIKATNIAQTQSRINASHMCQVEWIETESNDQKVSREWSPLKARSLMSRISQLTNTNWLDALSEATPFYKE